MAHGFVLWVDGVPVAQAESSCELEQLASEEYADEEWEIDEWEDVDVEGEEVEGD